MVVCCVCVCVGLRPTHVDCLCLFQHVSMSIVPSTGTLLTPWWFCRADHTQDVTTFLAWAASPEHDERKLMGIKGMAIIGIMWGFAIYHKRLRWSVLKSRKVVVDVV